MQQRLADAELLERFREDPEGEAGRRAVTELLLRYRDAVCVWCRRYVDDPELALDLSQEVLISAYRNLRRFEGRSGVAAWLMVIVRNRCLSEFRRATPVIDEDCDLELLPAPGPDPAEQMERRTREEKLLYRVNELLEPVEREAIWLRCVDGLSVDSITELLGITERSGARAILQRARRKLRRDLGADI